MKTWRVVAGIGVCLLFAGCGGLDAEQQKVVTDIRDAGVQVSDDDFEQLVPNVCAAESDGLDAAGRDQFVEQVANDYELTTDEAYVVVRAVGSDLC